MTLRDRRKARAPLSADFRTEPLWGSEFGSRNDRDFDGLLPPEAGIVIIGGGYTGISAALELAKQGQTPIVVEAGRFGQGASTRNGGITRAGLKVSLGTLLHKYGGLGKRLYSTTIDAQKFLKGVIAEEDIECHYRQSGYIKLAHSSIAAGRLQDQRDTYRSILPDHAPVFLGRDDLVSEIGTVEYWGGLLDMSGATLDPAKYFRGLLSAATREGACLVANTTARALEQSGGTTVVRTDRGNICAGAVLVATDGYTSTLFPPLARRVIPITSYVIATRPLSADIASFVLPTSRAFSDTKNFVHYWHLSPDRRLVFGGRASFSALSPLEACNALYAKMIEIFPPLDGVEIDYAWDGKVGYTRDHIPHVGRSGNVTYAVGYCGAGIALASLFGTEAARWMLGGDPPTFSLIKFPTVPLYSGRPWFLPLIGPYYQAKDRIS